MCRHQYTITRILPKLIWSIIGWITHMGLKSALEQSSKMILAINLQEKRLGDSC